MVTQELPTDFQSIYRSGEVKLIYDGEPAPEEANRRALLVVALQAEVLNFEGVAQARAVISEIAPNMEADHVISGADATGTMAAMFRAPGSWPVLKRALDEAEHHYAADMREPEHAEKTYMTQRRVALAMARLAVSTRSYKDAAWALRKHYSY